MSENVMEQAEQGMERYFFRASAKDLKKIAGSPLAYWLTSSFRDIFTSGTVVEELAGKVTKGIFTGNNNRFLRLWFEISSARIGWRLYDKAGGFRKWFGSAMHVVDWRKNGEGLKNFKGAGLGAIKFYEKPHFVWSGLTSGRPGFRHADIDVWFDDVSPSVVEAKDSDALLFYLNSKVATRILMTLNPTLHYQIGDVRKIPVPNLKAEYADVARDCIALARKDWNSYEMSWDFTHASLLHVVNEKSTTKLAKAYTSLRSHWREMTQEMQRLEEENNRIFIEAYGLQDELTPDVPLEEITLTCNPHYRYGGNKTDEEREALLLQDTMAEFCSYAVGCMFGRYSLDKPGLVLANQGDTLQDYLQQVPQPSFMPDDDNVIPLLDADWFADDVTGRFLDFLRVTFGTEHYAENLAFVERGLNIKNKRNYSIRDFFVKEFYDYHVRMYQKRPIYWLFASPKGTFQALVYLHRYRPDTVSVVLRYLREFRDKLDARRQLVEQRLTDASASQGEKTRLTKEQEQLRKQILELDDYEHDVLFPLAGQRLEIDLDDGVKTNYPRFGKALKKVAGLS